MNLVTPPAKELIASSKTHADAMIFDFNSDMARRVESHKRGFRKFWDSKVTPDDILLEWGSNAPVMLAAASESLQHIGRLAAIIGLTIDDFIPSHLYEPRRQFIISPEGVVTLEDPAFGHDAWGRFIPVPEDPQRTGYNENDEPTYGKYSDGTDILQPLPEGGIGYTADKEVIYGYDEDGTPILTPPVV